jgi:hypothetical protein
LLRSWYRLFPLNPYARFVGMIPLTILVAGLVLSGLGRYVNGYRHDPDTANTFSYDLTLFNEDVKGDSATYLVVTNHELAFYRAVAHYSPHANIIVSTVAPTAGTYTATRAAHTSIAATPSRIVTTAYSNDSDRFYIYQ